jgi:murein L,D-transpeptidase YcbB/YkuD
MRRPLLAALPIVWAFVAAACFESATTTPELQTIVSSETAPPGVPAAVWPDVQQFYAGRAQKLAWLLPSGPTERTAAAVDALRAAESHGLNPLDYGLERLADALSALEATGPPSARALDIAELDVRVTGALLQLGRHVATGRVTPTSIDRRWNVKREAPQYVAELQRAAEGTIESFFDAVAPRHPEYRALRDALGSLRTQAAAGWPVVPRATLKAGESNALVVRPLRRRLAAGGYLPPHAALDSDHYDQDVERAVKGFQHHHRLTPSGKLDRATVDRMNVPIDARIAQVALNLERWRWLPNDLGGRHLLVTVPFFDLAVREQGTAVMELRVIVGKRGNATPLFSDQLEAVVFSPYWNVPETIALQETIPAIERDPRYLARNNMEVVNAAGEVVPPDQIPWGDEAALATLRFRQRPGGSNALGHVKFLFPNEHAVYLHDTPDDSLFARPIRAFSHGCVRVDHAEQLAQWVLRDQPEWTGETIREAMHANTERHVRVTTAIPIFIVYLTARVDQHGGLYFADDVYDYDARQGRR